MATIKHIERGGEHLLCVECRIPLTDNPIDIYVLNRKGEVVCYGCVWGDHEDACFEREGAAIMAARLERAARGTMPPRRKPRDGEQGVLI